jgi:hypothetical protein
MNITDHFTLEELTNSKSHPEAVRLPNSAQVENLKRVCGWLEVLRRVYNTRYQSPDGKEQPIIINSGYRCPMLNKAVGGSPSSNHLTGCAVDIHCPGATYYERGKVAIRYATLLLEIAEVRKENFDELIIERKGTTWWIHFAVKEKANRGKITCITVC